MPRHMFQITVNVPASFRNNFNNNELLNPYIFVRNRLYHFVFHRFCVLYARLFSEIQRKLLEFFILVASLFCFIILVYVHVVFVQTPITCLEDYRDIWQNNGILRVEVLRGKENYTLEDSYWKEKTLRLQQYDVQSYYFYSEHTTPKGDSAKSEKENFEKSEAEAVIESFTSFDVEDFKDNYTSNISNVPKIIVGEENFQPIPEESVLATDPDGAYIMEFSLEYGFLRLRPSKRRDLNISVTFVVLDPDVDQCFGGSFNKFLLDNFLGYDNVLLASIKNMAERKDQKGFVRNAVMEIEYIFINNWTNEKSYLTAGFVMMFFTLTISILLRHSHHQIFIVVGFWMHHIISSMERPSNFFDVVWPRNLIPSSGAPVLTVVLALVGMEAVMSDFFHDRSIALHVIVIVWCADLYDAVCCQSPLSKRHWFKFFYLYHFLFYAYNYKFSGVYWPLTLMTSRLFTLHSMVFFFHHYELPRFLHRAAFMTANQANNAPQNGPPDNNPPENHTQAQDPVQPPTSPENGPEDQAADLEIDRDSSPEQPSAVDNLVTESISTSDCSAQSSVPGVDLNSKPKCCDDSRCLQINDYVEPKEEEYTFLQTPKCKSPQYVKDSTMGELEDSVKLLNVNSEPQKNNSRGLERSIGKLIRRNGSIGMVLREMNFADKNNPICFGKDLSEKILHVDSDPLSWSVEGRPAQLVESVK